MPRIIGIHGLAGHGKDTVANMIVKYLSPERTHILSFADPLKEIVSIITDIPNGNINANKTTLLPRYGMTVRSLLQKVGTDLFRDQLYPAIWLDIAHSRISSIPANKTVLIPDVRFENEISYIYGNQGICMYVYRPGAILDETVHRHKSECEQLSGRVCDYSIINDGSLEDLQTKVFDIMDEITQRR